MITVSVLPVSMSISTGWIPVLESAFLWIRALEEETDTTICVTEITEKSFGLSVAMHAHRDEDAVIGLALRELDVMIYNTSRCSCKICGAYVSTPTTFGDTLCKTHRSAYEIISINAVSLQTHMLRGSANAVFEKIGRHALTHKRPDFAAIGPHNLAKYIFADNKSLMQYAKTKFLSKNNTNKNTTHATISQNVANAVVEAESVLAERSIKHLLEKINKNK